MTYRALHLESEKSDRGFQHFPVIQATYPGYLRVYESSAAQGPHIWLATVQPNSDHPEGRPDATHLHLTAEKAWQLAEQLMTLVRDHYQGDARPERRAVDFL